MEEKKAVICDDDESISEILEFILTNAGYTVSRGVDGDEGLALLRSQKPRLLFLDIDMPNKDGIEVLTELGGDKGGTYIIVLSAHQGLDTQKKVLALGADEVMVKPFSAAEVGDKLAQLKKDGKI